MLEYIVGGIIGFDIILEILNSERLMEYLANYVKSKKYSVENDIPKRQLKEYERISKREAKKADEIYQFNHSSFIC